MIVPGIGTKISKLRKILIISPHYPPSNLAAVHRSRLFAQHLPAFGWTPIILTVAEDFYEEALDWNLYKLLPLGQQIEKVNALRITRPRLIGDIGLRGFFSLRKKALELVRKQGIDFVYIPVPSFYTSLLGPYLQKKTRVRYGIDYIDPWVHIFPGTDKTLSRHWWSTKLARFLEPLALRKASLVTGVAEGYYKGVISRNPGLVSRCLFGAMPYGGEEEDHRKVTALDRKPYLFAQKKGLTQLVYAGAMLPKAYEPLEALFRTISKHPDIFQRMELHFIGTGRTPNDREGYTVRPVAEKHGLWQKNIFEYPARIPYLDVLVHLEAANGVFILGSTEPHYTPSKLYQAVLSRKPVWAILHQKSDAFGVLEIAGAGISLGISAENLETIEPALVSSYRDYLAFSEAFSFENVNKAAFEKYSAFEVTRTLAALLEKAMQ